MIQDKDTTHVSDFVIQHFLFTEYKKLIKRFWWNYIKNHKVEKEIIIQIYTEDVFGMN